jgi:hypothetical protein
MPRIMNNIINGHIKANATWTIDVTGIASAPMIAIPAIGTKQHASMRSMCFLDIVSLHLPLKDTFRYIGDAAQNQRHRLPAVLQLRE